MIIRAILSGLMMVTLSVATTQLPILMYHHIRTPEPTDSALFRDLSCPFDLFSSHLDYLQQAGFNTVTFKEIENALAQRKPLGAHVVLLSFDDGGQDQWQAFQELARRGMKGVFFVTSGYVGSPRHLSPDQLRAMVEAGMEVGSHPVHHLDLTTLAPQAMQAELLRSKQELESIIGQTIIRVAYTAGRNNESVRKMSESVGYRYGRTTLPGIAVIASRNMSLPMIRIHNVTNVRELTKSLPRE